VTRQRSALLPSNPPSGVDLVELRRNLGGAPLLRSAEPSPPSEAREQHVATHGARFAALHKRDEAAGHLTTVINRKGVLEQRERTLEGALAEALAAADPAAARAAREALEDVRVELHPLAHELEGAEKALRNSERNLAQAEGALHQAATTLVYESTLPLLAELRGHLEAERALRVQLLGLKSLLGTYGMAMFPRLSALGDALRAAFPQITQDETERAAREFERQIDALVADEELSDV
jgi:chromosome segregation ATPase